MLLLPIVSRIAFPCEQAIEQGSKGADFPETRGLLPSFVSRIRFRCKQWKEQRKPSPKFSRNRGSSRPHRFENWLYLINRWKTGNERGRSSRNRGGGRHGTIGAPSPGGSGVRTARETLEGERGARPGVIAHTETVPRSDQRFKPDWDVDPRVKRCLVPRSLSSPRPGGVLSSSPGVAAGPWENDILQPARRLSGETRNRDFRHALTRKGQMCKYPPAAGSSSGVFDRVSG